METNKSTTKQKHIMSAPPPPPPPLAAAAPAGPPAPTPPAVAETGPNGAFLGEFSFRLDLLHNSCQSPLDTCLSCIIHRILFLS